jgi:Domain of unknown function (DUF4352)
VNIKNLAMITLVGCMLLVFSACGGASAPKPTTSAAPTSQAAPKVTAQTAPQKATAPANSPQANQAGSNADCAALYKANSSFGTALAAMVNLTADTNYSAYTDPSSPVYIDFKQVRASLDTLSKLPDPTDPTEKTFGMPSTSVAYFRQLVDVAEGDVKAQGKPFNDKNASGEKILGMDSPWMQNDASFGLAMDKVCSGFTLPADTPSASAASSVVGDTATFGDLKVTLTKVAADPGVVGNAPDAGNRFIVIYATIENTGKTTLSNLSIAQSNLSDAAGTLYGYSQKTVMLTSSLPGLTLNGEIQSGEKATTANGYEVPVDAGDLTWILNDNAQHDVTFAIPASSIVEQGTPITAADQNDADATATAFYEMINSVSETEDATTPEPEATVEPDATETPSP